MEARAQIAKLARPLAFVPTMGALHEGHAALVKEARTRGASVVVSIFVNPLQFGPNEDFDRYPRMFETDCRLLDSLGVSVVYAPSVETMYPSGFACRVDVGAIGRVYEGERRPGHFDGVATVMTKLLAIVDPDVFIMGQKDAQQVAVLRGLVRDFDVRAQMIVAPTVREHDGLALSSRNAYLDAAQRAAAPSLHRALDAVAVALEAPGTGIDAATAAGRAQLAAPLVEDYLAVVDPHTFERASGAIGSLVIGAVYAGKTRLLDNVFVGSR